MSNDLSFIVLAIVGAGLFAGNLIFFMLWQSDRRFHREWGTGVDPHVWQRWKIWLFIFALYLIISFIFFNPF